ncbi:MAG: prepilin-type N-terminal cleavage/methylation domain-containing protein [Tepidisphaeraceae bacterium]|jgi:hypothetical protein
MKSDRRAFTLMELLVVVGILVLAIIAVRSMTMMDWRIGLLGLTVPAGAILAATLAAALHPRLQGILITGTAIACLSQR